MVFVDHTAEYAVASDQAVDGQGGWPVLVVGCMLVECLMRPVRVVVPRVLRQDRGGVAFVVDQDTVSKLVVNLASLSRRRKRNELIRSPRSMARLRAA